MSNKEMVLAEDFLKHYSVSVSFIQSLNELGLVELVAVEEKSYIAYEQLQRLEQLISLHFDLDINPEGIDAIFNLLEKMRGMQSEINTLKNRLKIYED